MTSRSKICAALALASSAAAMLAAPAASAFSYAYVEGGYVDLDNGGADDGGFRLHGSFNVVPQVAAIVEYVDVGDLSLLSAGGVFHAPIQPALDWFAGVTYERLDIHSYDDSGIGLRGGLRWKIPSVPVQLIPEIRYVNYDDFDDMTSLRLTGLFTVAPRLDIQAAVQGGDDDRFEVGVRYNF